MRAHPRRGPSWAVQARARPSARLERSARPSPEVGSGETRPSRPTPSPRRAAPLSAPPRCELRGFASARAPAHRSSRPFAIEATTYRPRPVDRWAAWPDVSAQKAVSPPPELDAALAGWTSLPATDFLWEGSREGSDPEVSDDWHGACNCVSCIIFRISYLDSPYSGNVRCTDLPWYRLHVHRLVGA